MSGTDIKKPETREELIKILTESAKKTTLEKAEAQRRTTKPTISATAKALNIHRDTLYTWLKELNVDFKDVMDNIPTNDTSTNCSIQEAHTSSAKHFSEKETK